MAKYSKSSIEFYREWNENLRKHKKFYSNRKVKKQINRFQRHIVRMCKRGKGHIVRDFLLGKR